MVSRRQFFGKFMVGSAVAGLMFQNDALARIRGAVESIPSSSAAEDVAGDELFWSRVQSAFEVDRSMINFNNGGCSPSPRAVHNAFKRSLDYSNQSPSFHMWRHLEPHIETVREKLSRQFGCDKEEIAITRNTSEALEIAQLGIDFKPGDEVLSTTQAYGRMITTWDQLSRRNGVIYKKVKFPVPLLNTRDYVNSIEKAITPKTRAILVMHVINITGQIAPVKEISRLAHARGIPVICDGAHSFAHFPFTIKDLEVDYFGTSLHKWCYAPIGTGFLYVKKERIKETWPLMAARANMDGNIRKFEEIGTHPAANHNAIGEALAFSEAIGIKRKAARLKYLGMRWINRLKKFDNVKFMVNIDDHSQWCGVITVNVEGVDVGKLANYLYNHHRIYVVGIKHAEFQGIRVTPNIYSLISEVDIFASAMEKVARGEVPEVMATKSELAASSVTGNDETLFIQPT